MAAGKRFHCGLGLGMPWRLASVFIAVWVRGWLAGLLLGRVCCQLSFGSGVVAGGAALVRSGSLEPCGGHCGAEFFWPLPTAHWPLRNLAVEYADLGPR